jgi:magnesium transporter
MLTCFIKFGDGRIVRNTDPDTLALALRDTKASFWLDMQQPSKEEYALLDEVFGFHPLAIEDSMHHVQRPKIESYSHVGDSARHGYFYMVIHGPNLDDTDDVCTRELDMFVSERYLVTIHDEPVKSITDLFGRAQADCSVVLDPGIDMLLYTVLDRLIDDYQPILDRFGEELDDIEDQSVTNPIPPLLTRISLQKRHLLHLRRIVGPQRDVMAQLTRGEVPFIRESARVYFRDIQDHLNRAVETIELYRDLVQGARDIYMSSVSNNLNQIMKTLTIITVIALPLTVITSFFGMNFELDFLKSPTTFWYAIVITLVLDAFLLWMFWRKKWI